MTTPKHFIAIDWSGRATPAGQRRHIYVASWFNGAVTLKNGYTHQEVCALLLAAAKQTPELVVGLDFAFSFPAWWLREQNCKSAPKLWQRATDEGERWLREAHDPFWGRPGRPKPRDQEGFRETDRQLNCKSPFQIGGAGAVGTGSIRGMPMLARLHQEGFHIWPFQPAKLPLALEIYPRLFTGPVIKSSPKARAEHLKQTEFANLSPEILHTAANSEDAFDALCSVRGMVEHAEHLNTLNEGSRLEGEIWKPK